MAQITARLRPKDSCTIRFFSPWMARQSSPGAVENRGLHLGVTGEHLLNGRDRGGRQTAGLSGHQGRVQAHHDWRLRAEKRSHRAESKGCCLTTSVALAWACSRFAQRRLPRQFHAALQHLQSPLDVAEPLAPADIGISHLGFPVSNREGMDNCNGSNDRQGPGVSLVHLSEHGPGLSWSSLAAKRLR